MIWGWVVWSRVEELCRAGGGLVWDGKVSSGVGVVVGRCDLGLGGVVWSWGRCGLGLGKCDMELGEVWYRVGKVWYGVGGGVV